VGRNEGTKGPLIPEGKHIGSAFRVRDSRWGQ
jgi:hypothetical protein